MTESETTAGPANRDPVRILAKTMWQMDAKGTFETAEERQAAFGEAKKEYRRKAARMLKMLEKKGAALVVSDAPETDA